MEIKVDCYYWRDNKIAHHQNIELTEEDIFEILQTKSDNDELPVPIHLNKDDLRLEFSLDTVTI